MTDFSLTRTLLAADPERYRQATQARFLQLGAQGKLSKDVFRRWLANDRLYIHGYIRCIGRMLTAIDLQEDVPPNPKDRVTPTTRFLDWLIEALVNIRREEKFFVESATTYGVDLNLGDPGEPIPQVAKLPGLVKYEKLFGEVSVGEPGQSLAWLECAVLFWATEKYFLDAWSWAKTQETGPPDGSHDIDRGCLRKDLIPNWTSDGFRKFVDGLGAVLDDGVREVIERDGEAAKSALLERARLPWNSALQAEMEFWPAVEE